MGTILDERSETPSPGAPGRPTLLGEHAHGSLGVGLTVLGAAATWMCVTAIDARAAGAPSPARSEDRPTDTSPPPELAEAPNPSAPAPGRVGSAPTILADGAPPIEGTRTRPPRRAVAAQRDEPECFPTVVLRYGLGEVEPPGDLPRILAPTARWLIAHPEVAVVVRGHSDAPGSRFANLQVSQRRAERVARALVASGVERPRISVQALGEYQPVVGVDPRAATNRRVEVQAVGIPPCAQGPEATFQGGAL